MYGLTTNERESVVITFGSTPTRDCPFWGLLMRLSFEIYSKYLDCLSRSTRTDFTLKFENLNFVLTYQFKFESLYDLWFIKCLTKNETKLKKSMTLYAIIK